MKKLLLFILFSGFCTVNFSQNIQFAREIIDTLASESFHGRGYSFKGDSLTAAFLKQKLVEKGVKAFKNNFLQRFYINVNTFSGNMSVSFDKQALSAGTDYIIADNSPSVKGKFKVLLLDKDYFENQQNYADFNSKDLSKYIVVTDTGFQDFKYAKIYSSKAVVILIKDNITWGADQSGSLANVPIIYVKRDVVNKLPKKINLDIESDFKSSYKTQNVIGYIPGSVCPDSFIVFSAHYDHLGTMGRDVYFPGAHDNASGCAFLLDLVNYYSKPENTPEYSICFMFFSAEETGINGSKFYVNNPLFPVGKIKLLLNIDMVSTGSEGLKVVNGSIFNNEFELLSNINQQNQYLKTISPRGEAANSDHFWFYKNNVKALYIYTLGDEWNGYHNVYDVSNGLPLTEYNDVFRLIIDFVKRFSDD